MNQCWNHIYIPILMSLEIYITLILEQTTELNRLIPKETNALDNMKKNEFAYPYLQRSNAYQQLLRNRNVRNKMSSSIKRCSNNVVSLEY